MSANEGEKNTLEDTLEEMPIGDDRLFTTHPEPAMPNTVDALPFEWDEAAPVLPSKKAKKTRTPRKKPLQKVGRAARVENTMKKDAPQHAMIALTFEDFLQILSRAMWVQNGRR